MKKKYIKPTISAILTEPIMLVVHSNDYAESKPKEWIEEEEEEPAQKVWGLEKEKKADQWGAAIWNDSW